MSGHEPRLTLLLGGGGVGKTTLAAGLALSLARRGRHVGLLTIDPAERLRTALGLEALGETPILVAGALPGTLRAASLRPADTLRRWGQEAVAGLAHRDQLLQNPFFIALSDRLAGASDTIAAIRVAEWIERDPAVDDLVIDTAPGLQAVDFLAKPERLSAFLQGRIVSWARRFALDREAPGSRLRALLLRPARGRLEALEHLGGAGMLLHFGQFLSLVEAALPALLDRLAHSRRLLRASSSRLLLVAAPRPDAVRSIVAMRAALDRLELRPRATVLNRALPEAMGPALEVLPAEALADPRVAALVSMARGSLRLQRMARAALAGQGLPLLPLPDVSGLEADGTPRLDGLTALGSALLAQLP